LALFLFQPRSHFVDLSGVKICLNVRCVGFPRRLDTGAAVFGDPVDVGSFQQAQTNIRVGGSRSSLAIEFEIPLIQQNCLEKLWSPASLPPPLLKRTLRAESLAFSLSNRRTAPFMPLP
jgi:hypothetical protein